MVPNSTWSRVSFDVLATCIGLTIVIVEFGGVPGISAPFSQPSRYASNCAWIWCHSMLLVTPIQPRRCSPAIRQDLRLTEASDGAGGGDCSGYGVRRTASKF